MFKENWRANFLPPEIRDIQGRALERSADYLDAGSNVLSELGTGVGKSWIAHCLAKTANQAFIVTSDNQLVRQYERDFAKVAGFKSIKGRGNYTCADDEDADCESGADFNECPYAASPREGATGSHCPYIDTKIQAQAAPVAFTNIAYYATAMRFDEKWAPRRLAVFDEAHSLENSLYQMVEVVVDRRRLSVFTRAGIPCDSNTLRDLPSEAKWVQPKNWRPRDGRPIAFDSVLALAEVILERGIVALERWADSKQMAGSKKALANVVDNLSRILNKPDDLLWVADLYEYGPSDVEYESIGPIQLTIKPVYIRDFTKMLIFQQAEQFVFQSATIIDGAQFAYELGIYNWKGMKFRSPFPAENRRVFALDAGNLRQQDFQSSIGPCTAQLEEILQARPHQRGIVHTASYALQEHLRRSLKPNPRYLFPKAGENEMALNRHSSSSSPTVLFSPSMTQGVDLKNDLARFCVVFKVPYPNWGDRRIYRKTQLNRGWYDYATAKTLIQATGRGVRSPEDWCDIFVIDSAFNSFYKKYDRLHFYFEGAIEFDKEKAKKAIYEHR